MFKFFDKGRTSQGPEWHTLWVGQRKHIGLFNNAKIVSFLQCHKAISDISPSLGESSPQGSNPQKAKLQFIADTCTTFQPSRTIPYLIAKHCYKVIFDLAPSLGRGRGITSRGSNPQKAQLLGFCQSYLYFLGLCFLEVVSQLRSYLFHLNHHEKL